MRAVGLAALRLSYLEGVGQVDGAERNTDRDRQPKVLGWDLTEFRQVGDSAGGNMQTHPYLSVS